MLPDCKRIKSKGQLKDYLNCELPRYGRGGWIRSIFPVTESDVLRKHQLILRKAEYYTNTGRKILSLFYRVRLSWIQNKYGIHIPINTCGKGLKVMHVGPILLNGNVSVGENFSVHINTGLVAGGLDDGAPQLGDGIVMGIGSVVIGSVKIADNVAIGANAVVTRDILEEDIAVAGVPARKVSENGRSKWNNKKVALSADENRI